MAIKHRKLFPALTETNQTVDCPDFCDPCPYNCYTYSDYYFLPPPPPPPPEHRISPYVIVIVSLLAAFFLLVCYYVIIAKSCPSWFCWRNNRQQEDEAEDTEGEFVEENQVDHPIWFITTAGLQQSIINLITVCKYKKGEGLIEGTECSVCLSEFQQDETVRLLPKCNHAFHISCIDTWLRSHTNCPMCRASIFTDSVITTPLALESRNSENSNRIEDTQMENSENENRGGAEEVICESPKIEIKAIRRSVSLDSLTAVNMGLEIEETSDNKTEHTIVLNQEIRNSSVTKHLHKSPVSMKRSFSCGGRFFCSRQNRNLPL